jgi:hypothetical protein
MSRSTRPERRPGLDRRGGMLIELALLLPFLALLLLGATDMSRLALSTMKLHRVAAEVADLGAQFDSIHQGMQVVNGNEVGVLFVAARQIADPLNLDAAGCGVVVTAVADQGAGPRIMWQVRSSPSAPASALGSVAGKPPTLPAGFTVTANETALLVEVFYSIKPYALSAGLLRRANTPVQLRQLAVFRPRYGSLNTLEP